MTTLTQDQKSAIDLTNQLLASNLSSIIKAAQIGEKLAAVKDELPHGEFTNFLEEHMPVSVRQCQKYIKLYKGNKALALQTYLNSVLDIDSEILMQKTDDDIENTVRKKAAEENLTQAEIAELVKKLEASDEASVQSPTETDLSAEDILNKFKKAVTGIKKNTKVAVSDSDAKYDVLISDMLDLVEKAEDSFSVFENEIITEVAETPAIVDSTSANDSLAEAA